MSMTGRRLAAGGALLLTLVLVVVLSATARNDGHDPPREPSSTTPAGARTRPPRSIASPAALRAFADDIAVRWRHERNAAGLFVDPVTGGARHGFGQVLLGQVLMEAGVRRDDPALRDAGLRAITTSLRRSVRLQEAENPIGLLAAVRAYAWARAHLAGSRPFERAEPAWRHMLAAWSAADVGPKAQGCFHHPRCWDNYKPLEAAAELRLLHLGLRPSTADAVAGRPGAAAAARAVLAQRFDRATGQAARWSGAGGGQAGLGVNSDQPTYPLAYQAMTAMSLASALDRGGADLAGAGRRALARVMSAEAALTAPDGDLSWLGRAQGQSWALAAAVYAARVCAWRLAAARPAVAARCLTLADRAFARLRNRHGIGAHGVNIVPRYRFSAHDGRGLDRYAREMSFNGLTAALLDWAADVPSPPPGLRPQPLPLDRDGAFVDPAHAHVAVVRHGDVWFAAHSVGPVGVFDARYGFGLLALKVRNGAGRWHDALPAPPRLGLGTAPAPTAGPLLATPAGVAQPWGTSLRADPRTGRVTIDGGFVLADGTWVRENVRFVLRPVRRGVAMTVSGVPGQTLVVQRWSTGGRGCTGRFASAYAPLLRACRATVSVGPSGRWSSNFGFPAAAKGHG